MSGGPLFSDWDRSGRSDLRISNDRHYYSNYSDGQEQLWRVASGAPPKLYAGNEGWENLNVWGMGIASYDVTGDGYQLGWIHFGLGGADTAQVRVKWPDGEMGPWLTVTPNQFAVIERGVDEARPWLPKP
jgi:hypothetical protein